MPPDPPGGTRPAGPVVLRIKLRYDDVEAMINRFAPNVGKSGLFLPTKSLQPVGSEIKFELRLSNDTAVLLGLGRVKATKSPDPNNPKASFGMAIELMRVTKESRDLIMRMLERRRQLGLADVALPLPADVDASRRSDLVETAVKAPPSAPIPSAEAAPAESLLTAPRRQSGPLAVQKAIQIAPLAPEAPRKKRPALQELIDRASGPVAAVSVLGLDEDVDVGAVIARARALAGGDLDRDLEMLRESQATPIEIDVEAASAELARQLGGAAVRRGQSAPTSWAPPPEIAAKVVPEAVVPELVVPEPASPEPVEEPVVQLVDEMIVTTAPVETVATTPTTPKIHEAVTTVGDHIPLDFDTELPRASEREEEHEVEPEQIDDEIHQLGEADFEEVEHTHIGGARSAFEPHAFATTPKIQAELESKLDEQLAEAEQESEHDDLGIGEASGHYLRSKIGLPPAEILEDEDAAEAPEPVAEKAEVTPLPAEYQQDFIHRFADEPVDQPVLASPIQGFEDEEIDDFEILAEADAEDADLLTSSGEAEVSAHHTLPPDLTGDVPDGEFTLPPENEEPALRESDFAMRLDFGDDDEDAPEQLDLAASAGHALAGFDDDDSNQHFTAAELDEPHAELSATGFSPPGRFDQSDVIPLAESAPPNVSWDDNSARNQWVQPPQPASDEIDLESALEALDVDLDDLSAQSAPVPHAPTELARSDSPQRRATIRPPSEHQLPSERRSQRIPRGRAPRASTEDGVLIDFDDDDE